MRPSVCLPFVVCLFFFPLISKGQDDIYLNSKKPILERLEAKESFSRRGSGKYKLGFAVRGSINRTGFSTPENLRANIRFRQTGSAFASVFLEMPEGITAHWGFGVFNKKGRLDYTINSAGVPPDTAVENELSMWYFHMPLEIHFDLLKDYQKNFALYAIGGMDVNFISSAKQFIRLRGVDSVWASFREAGSIVSQVDLAMKAGLGIQAKINENASIHLEYRYGIGINNFNQGAFRIRANGVIRNIEFTQNYQQLTLGLGVKF